MNIKQITKCAIFCALICVGALIKIPIPNLPITMQMLFVFMAAMLLTQKEAVFCVGVYIILGVAGLPVFASGGGAGYILSPSFGYVLGFLPGVYFGGRFAGEGRFQFIKTAMICLLTVYAVGIPYFCFISRFVLHVHISFEYITKLCLFAMLPGDVLSAMVATVIAKKLKKTHIFS